MAEFQMEFDEPRFLQVGRWSAASWLVFRAMDTPALDQDADQALDRWPISRRNGWQTSPGRFWIDVGEGFCGFDDEHQPAWMPMHRGRLPLKWVRRTQARNAPAVNKAKRN